MKKLSVVFLLIALLFTANAQQTEINGCYVTYYSHDKSSSHSFEIYGNVYVEKDPKQPVDLRVKIVYSEKEATYNIYRSSDTPKKCGEWRFVNNRKDARFVIRYVKEHEDCTIRFVPNRSDAGCWGNFER